MRNTTLLALVLLLGGCHGSLTLGGDPFRGDDDDAADDDDAGDDDDSVGDDDDSVGDDDDAVSFDDAAGVFTIIGVIQHPEGRFSQGTGYFFLSDQTKAATEAVEETLPRGGDFGCEVTTPDSDGRGGDFVTFDAGPFAQMWLPGAQWQYDMSRVEQDDLVYYWANSQNGQPPTVPPDEVLSIYVPGGADIPELQVDDVIPTQAPFPVDRPSLIAGAQQLEIDPEAGLPFQWTPLGQAGLGIGVEFFDQATQQQWSIECWVEDTGSFVVEAALLRQMPEGMTGATWIRRLQGGWLDGTSEHPPIYGQGALQHRWLIVLGVPTTDG